jgi:hypothetical protein
VDKQQIIREVRDQTNDQSSKINGDRRPQSPEDR